MNLQIAVLMGGSSSEREISLKTGTQVAQALRRRGYAVTTLDLTPQTPAQLLDLKPDVVYIALHGRPGEDGTVQGMLEVLQLPYVGSGVLASAVGMDKRLAKEVFRAAGIRVPAELTLTAASWREKAEEILAAITARFCTPLVVKANSQGSALGVQIIQERGEIRAAIQEILTLDPIVLVEEYIPGTEITVALLGDPPQPLPVIEIVPRKGFYDFEAKYQPGLSEHIIPARLPEAVAREAQILAVRAYESLGCRDFARVDLRVTPEGVPYVLEINTLPGMTETSLVPDAARAVGLSFEDLCVRLVEGARARGGK